MKTTVTTISFEQFSHIAEKAPHAVKVTLGFGELKPVHISIFNNYIAVKEFFTDFQTILPSDNPTVELREGIFHVKTTYGSWIKLVFCESFTIHGQATARTFKKWLV